MERAITLTEKQAAVLRALIAGPADVNTVRWRLRQANPDARTPSYDQVIASLRRLERRGLVSSVREVREIDGVHRHVFTKLS